jgi:uncharacterized UPF0146 family protein
MITDSVREDSFRELADIYRDDVSDDALSVYYRTGAIDSDRLKKAIQEAIETAERAAKYDLPSLRAFLNYVIRTGQRGPVQDWGT